MFVYRHGLEEGMVYKIIRKVIQINYCNIKMTVVTCFVFFL